MLFQGLRYDTRRGHQTLLAKRPLLSEDRVKSLLLQAQAERKILAQAARVTEDKILAGLKPQSNSFF